MWALLLSRILFSIQVKERYSPGYWSLFFFLYLSISTNYSFGEEEKKVFAPSSHDDLNVLWCSSQPWKCFRENGRTGGDSVNQSSCPVFFPLKMWVLCFLCWQLIAPSYASLFASFLQHFHLCPKGHNKHVLLLLLLLLLRSCLLSWAGLFDWWTIFSTANFLCRLHSQSSKYANDDAAATAAATAAEHTS